MTLHSAPVVPWSSHRRGLKFHIPSLWSSGLYESFRKCYVWIGREKIRSKYYRKGEREGVDGEGWGGGGGGAEREKAESESPKEEVNSDLRSLQSSP